MRNVLATLTGIICAALITFGFEMIGAFLFPLPEGSKPMDAEWLKDNIHLIPLGAMVLVVFAHALGLVFGMYIASIIAKNSLTPTYIVAAFMSLSTIANLFMIPHPNWFIACDVTGIIIGYILGLKLSKSKLKSTH
ncbi:MAG: hypothetical protein BM564_00100 [Bacteroidetes bacterium MedPE-SWsnd-G2]|nr:MAG: hypothetical protein BM564_00100 [Bacteroidetes bacterium MedPE-SWsnd-G2]